MGAEKRKAKQKIKWIKVCKMNTDFPSSLQLRSSSEQIIIFLLTTVVLNTGVLGISF